MIEKILEQKINKLPTKKFQSNINKKLDKLNKDLTEPWVMNYKWSQKATKLHVKSENLAWKANFTKKKVGVSIEFPFYLIPFLLPLKKKVIGFLQEEIKELM